MVPISSREWLYELADRSDVVKRYLKIHNTQFTSDEGRPPPDVLTPAVLIGLIYVLVEQNSAAERHRAALVEVNDLLLSVPPGEDWRAVVREKVVKALYGDAAWKEVRHSRHCPDFLKSYWHRLRRHFRVW